MVFNPCAVEYVFYGRHIETLCLTACFVIDDAHALYAIGIGIRVEAVNAAADFYVVLFAVNRYVNSVFYLLLCGDDGEWGVPLVVFQQVAQECQYHFAVNGL